MGVPAPTIQFGTTTMDCTCGGGGGAIWQMLLQHKQWPGCGKNLQIPHVYLWDGAPLPSLSFRQQFRKHYQTHTVVWAMSPEGYTCVDTYSGPGFFPNRTGCPDTITGTPPSPVVQSGSNTAVFIMFSLGFPPVDNDWGALGCEIDTQISWTFATFDFPDCGGGGNPDQTQSLTLSTEITCGSQLSTAMTRLGSRGFPTFPSVNTVHCENFYEYPNYEQTGPGSDPGYNMSAVAQADNSIPIVFIPWFGALDPDGAHLISFWFVYTWEVNGANLDVAGDAVGIGNYPIQAVRTRFKATSACTYFVADARVVDFDGGTNSLADCKFVTSGSLAAGAILSIAMPTTPAVDTDFVVTGGKLSNGQIRFVILNETSAAWSARTGITIT